MNTYIINFILNKVCPYLCIFVILFTTVGLSNPLCYFIIPFIIFIDKYSFKAGYSVAYCEVKKIDLNNRAD